jgi:hypothetical protein
VSYRTPSRPPISYWQRVSQVLAVLLVVLVGAAAAVVLLRPPQNPLSTPGPTLIAAGSPSPRLTPKASIPASALPSASAEPSEEPSPSPTEEPSPSPTLEASPSPTAEASPSPTVEPTPTAVPTIAPTAPLRAITFLSVGFDGENASTQTQRVWNFRSEGPGSVTARLFKTTEGLVHFCLGRRDETPTCVDDDKAFLIATTEDSGKTAWTVTAIGMGPAAPIADVKLLFRTSRPIVTIDGFRFQGVENSGYNGIEAEFDVDDQDDFRVDGEWEGAPRPWHAQLADVESGETIVDDSGTGNDLRLETPLGPRTVHLSITNTEEFADQEVFLHAQIRWP